MPLLKATVRFYRHLLRGLHGLYFGVVAGAVLLALGVVAGGGFFGQLPTGQLAASALDWGGTGSVSLGGINFNLGGLFGGSKGSDGFSAFGSGGGVSFGGSTDVGGLPPVRQGGGTVTAPGCGETDNCLIIPDTSAYSGIATETSLRQTVLNWVNFFLGFLSLIAMIAIIYAGFLYVTAFGDDDATGKAKNIIMYTLIGIVVIFLAFALVNTFIVDGPKGGDLVSDVLQVHL